MLNICEVFPIRKNLIRNIVQTPGAVTVWWGLKLIPTKWEQHSSSAFHLHDDTMMIMMIRDDDDDTLIMIICDADDDNGSDQGGIHIYRLLST